MWSRVCSLMLCAGKWSVRVFMYIHMWGGARLSSGVFIDYPLPYILRKQLSTVPRPHKYSYSSQQACSRDILSLPPDCHHYRGSAMPSSIYVWGSAALEISTAALNTLKTHTLATETSSQPVKHVLKANSSFLEPCKQDGFLPLSLNRLAFLG